MPRVRIVWHAGSREDVLKALETGWEGISPMEAQDRLEADGPNVIEEGKKKTILNIIINQFKSPMIWVLIAAALISGFLSEWADSVIIGVVVLINAVTGTVQESRAEAALDALKQMSAPFATVIRAGMAKRIPASDLVPGDVVELQAGDSVPADIRLLEVSSLKAEESALTGESEPVLKFTDVVDDPSAAVGDRKNMVHMGASISYGRGVGVVTATGMDTQLGKIAGQLNAASDDKTPMQKKLGQMTNYISIGVLAIAAIIFTVGMLYGNQALEMFMTAVSLAVAAIPEGMAAVVTIVLAIGMQKMAAQGAIIRRLPAVETLGSAQVICSDKTGTLTVNRMTMQRLWTADNYEVAIKGAMFHCNDGRPGDDSNMIGDPTETALLDYLIATETCTVEDILSRRRADEIPFDSERKLSTVVIQLPDGQLRVYVKGAPDALLGRCVSILRNKRPQPMIDDDVAKISALNADMASGALRVLAFAYKDVSQVDTSNQGETENGLIFLGLAGMIDPERPEARTAIAECRQAGIATVMITGDHRLTAEAIAVRLGLLDDGRISVTGSELEDMSDETLFEKVDKIGVYARVSPEHKTRIVNALQNKGMVVAMTGDGVNDAPALKAADIGVGMGITGTDVSKGAADMVLTDDNFATIVAAVREGRRIFDNIQKAVKFLLSSNCGEVLTMLVATFAGWHVLSPVQILWVNLVTDTFPALALGVEPEEAGVMDRPPRPAERPFFTAFDWTTVGVFGAFEAALALTAFVIGRGASPQAGMTMAFATLSLSQLFAAVSYYSRGSIFRIAPMEHKMLWLALAASLALQLIVMLAPPLRAVFGLVELTGIQWLIVAGLSVGMLAAAEIYKWIIKLVNKNKEQN